MITLASKIKRSPEIVHSKIDGETVMMSIQQGEYYGLDTIGSHVWALLDEETNVSDLCDKLSTTYAVDESTCQADVIHFLQDTFEHNIIEIVS